MPEQPSPNTSPVPRDDGERSTYGVFLSAANHSFWNQESVPKPDSDDFQRRITGSSKNTRVLHVPIFEPEARHCGVWHSPPNKSCHSSFGDQGTTASTNCFGDIIQVTQYLGAGRSGVFSMDQQSTPEPFFVWSRADNLKDLIKDNEGSLFSYDLLLHPEFFPREPLNVKWVNWRWPRYEYDTSLPQVKSCAQWVVHNGTVLKQLVLENSSQKDIEFGFAFTRDMWIRDLDYLDATYHFNDTNEGYSEVPGPNGFGYVCIHTLDPLTKVDSSSAGGTPPDAPLSSRRPSNGPEPTYPFQNQDTPHDPMIAPSTQPQKAQQPEPHIAENTLDSSDKAQPRSPSVPEQAWTKAEETEETTSQINNAHAVASVVTFFVNGKAINTQGTGGAHTFTLAGKDPNSTEPRGTTLEVVVAYRMILIPSAPIDWRNFLVSAEEADVNAILLRETESLWEAAESPSLLSLGLSLVDSGSNIQKMASDVSNTTLGKGKNDSSKQPTDGGSKGIKSDTGSIGPTVMESFRTGDGHRRRPTVQDPTTPFSSKPETTEYPTGTPGKASSKNHIEYLAWRHLEHILSVCAVPLSPPALFEGSGSPNSSHVVLTRRAVDAPIALTCGDMAGHRICHSASFFAFTFLVDVARRLDSLQSRGTHSLYIQSLQRRIKTVCQGHIAWIKLLRSRTPTGSQPSGILKSGCFAANYWVTGFITPRESATWQPDNAVTDTPFQILITAEYLRLRQDLRGVWDDEDEIKAARELLLDVWIPWLIELDKTDRRSIYAWPHAIQENVSIFRLDDHIWVWKALKSLDGLEGHLRKYLTSSKSVEDGKFKMKDRLLSWMFQLHASGSTEDQLDEIVGVADHHLDEEAAIKRFDVVAKRLVPGEIQRNVLQNFTTENDVSRKRMLAVTRSPRETRFLFHSRDTSLFFAEDLEFFLPASAFHELWENTIEAQPHHDENRESTWDNAVRYALGIVVGTRGCSLNKKSPTELVRSCVEVLLRSSSHAGFFPGQLDEATKEPRVFYDEEDINPYHHAGFEINYILLTHAERINKAFEKAAEFSPRPLRSSATMPVMERDSAVSSARVLAEMIMGLATQPKHHWLNEQGKQSHSLSLAQLAVSTGLDTRRSLTMKKLIPFNNLIDVSSIIALEDEWLYSYPECFTMEDINPEEFVNTFLKSDQSSRDAVGGIIGQELELCRAAARAQQQFRFPSPANVSLGTATPATFIAETPKQKHLGKQERKKVNSNSEQPTGLTNSQLWSTLCVARTAKKAKKRFIWLPRANAETAFICWAASSEAARPAMSLFFDRHSRYEKQVWDNTFMAYNAWLTELHLSFYILVDADLPHTLGLPLLSKDRFPGSSKKELRRASCSFRFDGDFFDRYWTCHYIGNWPQMLGQPSWPFSFTSSGRHEEKKWWQRKFLEIFLLLSILQYANESSLEILDQVKSELGVGGSTLSFSILDGDAYVSTREHWQGFEYILQAVDEDLSAVLQTLEKWDRREAGRDQEKPRWTRSDERKYRGDISKLQGAIEREKRNLENYVNNIRKLKETLTTTRAKIRDDRELHRNENIRYFTYVTVIFLPLGFAASFYSMSGVPQPSLMISLVEFAIAAFGVTVGLLASAKVIFGAVDIILLPLRSVRKQAELALEKYSRTKRESSLLHGDRERLHLEPDAVEVEQTANVPIQRTETQVSNPNKITEGRARVLSPPPIAQDVSTSPAWFWFWLTYIFFEVPLLRILIAIDILEKRKLSLRSAADVFLGIVFLPVFAHTWAVKFVFLNLQDLVRLLNRVQRSILSARSNATAASHADAEGALHRRFARITAAPDSYRPFKELEKKLEERSKTGLTGIQAVEI